MTSEEKELLRSRIADFRYSVVAELCNPYLHEEEKKQLIAEKTSRSYQIPGSRKTSITAATIRNWLRLYQRLGKEGLLPRQREDRGRPRSFSDAEAHVLLDLLERHPKLSVTAAIRMLSDKGKISSRISSSAASRFAQANCLGRKDRSRAKRQAKDTRRFAFEAPLACVQADAMHAFKVYDDNDRNKKAILLAFIDDATRRILYARFDTSENSILFEDGIKHILKAHGRIGKLYTDNGSTFISNQTKRIAETLGINITHSKPYRPQGRGKIERFFRTVRDQFLEPLDRSIVSRLAHLNYLFAQWLETEYHRNVHSSLGTTPVDAWISKTHLIKHSDPMIDLDEAFFHHVKRKVYNDSIVSLQGTAFEVPTVLIGKQVHVFYDPHVPILRIKVTHGGVDYGEAKPVDTFANTKIKRNGDFTKELEFSDDPKGANPVNFKSINEV